MPHLWPLLDRVVPRGYHCPGSYTELPRYRPIDFLRQPSSVKSLAEAVDAIRFCDEIATSLAVQRHAFAHLAHAQLPLPLYLPLTLPLPLPLPLTLTRQCSPQTRAAAWAPAPSASTRGSSPAAPRRCRRRRSRFNLSVSAR